MTSPLRTALAVVFAVVFLGLLLGLLAASQFGMQSLTKDKVIVREVALAAPPPPPPPPPVTKSESYSTSALHIDAGSEGGELQIVLGKAKVDALPEPVRPQLKHFQASDWEFDWSAELQTFGLGELDTRPRLLVPLRVAFPDSLQRRAIKKASAKLHVVIDEKGEVTLKAIKYLQYPELKPGVLAAIRMARFTAPSKDGKAVRAEFLWPVELVSGGG
ncbi:MAG: hypothetical protein CSA53_06355 [Gammaproteobacteria bacterium]|nr:MAG: hypothetical protein CSA53_06355 [Gammaproteobacteria bacterium]